MNASLHEIYERPEIEQIGSNLSFGIVMAAAFGIVAGMNLWHDGVWWPLFGGIAGLFLIAALLFPVALTVPNRLWFKLGMMLHHIINLIIMGLIFYVTILLTGLVFRALGKDILRLKREPEADSYWIRRPPARRLIL